VYNQYSYSFHIMQPLCGPANGLALLPSAVSSDRDWAGRCTYLLNRFLSGELDICYIYPTHFTCLVSSRTGSPPQSHPVAASSETRMTLSVPMIYIAHNEGRVSDTEQVICDSSRWSHRSARLLNHDGGTARYLRAGQIGARFAE